MRYYESLDADSGNDSMEYWSFSKSSQKYTSALFRANQIFTKESFNCCMISIYPTTHAPKIINMQLVIGIPFNT
jgi:hypothetical protein